MVIRGLAHRFHPLLSTERGLMCEKPPAGAIPSARSTEANQLAHHGVRWQLTTPALHGPRAVCVAGRSVNPSLCV